jgi:hypothetical protein
VTDRPGAYGSTPARRYAVVAVLLATLLGGWLWGASGRWELVRALRTAEARRNLVEARASLLGARVSLCDADFAGLNQQIEDARWYVGRVSAGLSAPGVIDRDHRIDLAGLLAEIDEAQRLAGTAVSPARDGQPLRQGHGPSSLVPAHTPAADAGWIRPGPIKVVSTAPFREPGR